MSPILLCLFGLVCLWAGYRCGKISAVARAYERTLEHENQEFLDRLRARAS
jgi:hypothetical protein